MRFCEYFQDYRIRKGLTYVELSRIGKVDPKTIRKHCHGHTFPRFETFVDYCISGVLDFEDLLNSIGSSVDDVKKMPMYDAMPLIYLTFKGEERKNENSNEN